MRPKCIAVIRIFLGIAVGGFASFAMAAEPLEGDPYFLQPSEIQSLTPAARLQYKRELLKLYIAFENSDREIHPLAKTSGESAFVKAVFKSLNAASTVMEEKPDCLIGGVLRPIEGKKCTGRHHRGACRTLELKDPFQCGEIFRKSCVKRVPSTTLLERCAETVSDENLGSASDDTVHSLKVIFDKLCESGGVRVNRVGCENLEKGLINAKAASLGQHEPKPTPQ